MASINDPNNASNIAVVKAASTVPAAADMALVVAISPNSASLASATATLSSVAGSASSVTVLAANVARRAANFYNESTATLNLAFALTASSSSYTVQIPAGGYYEMPIPIYTGLISGIWSSATGNVRVTELT